MKYAQVIYKGATDKIGRFNTVETGQTLTLTESEYECVREDARYEFVEWVKVDLPKVQPALAQSPSYSLDRSPVNEDPIKREASRVSQDIIREDDDDDTVEDYSKLTVKELVAEIKARNELLDDEEQIVPASQKKKDLISALEENDENDA
jgi:hypothetical protein